MIKAQKIFSYLNHTIGVTKDGEQYVVLNVIDKETTSKFSFISKQSEVIDKVAKLQCEQYKDIRVFLNFYRDFNQKTRYSNWRVELLGCEV